LSNKLNSKRFASRYGVTVAQTYWEGRDPEAMPFSSFPDAYVVKTSIGWCARQVLPVICGRNAFTGREMSHVLIMNHFRQIMSHEPYSSAHLIVEELVGSDSREAIPKDYKCYCFGGKVRFIQVVNRLKREQRWYEPNWHAVRDQMHLAFNYAPAEPAPASLVELIRCADLLSTAYEYPFVRVDMYCGSRCGVFGEFTHAPCAGATRNLYTPYANRVLGGLWKAALEAATEGGGA
jgi:hypothetical protein